MSDHNVRPAGTKKNWTHYESNLSVSWREMLKSGSSGLHERIRGCWMGTAYLAGLCAGASQRNIPSTSLSLRVLGLIVRGVPSVLIMFLEVK